MTHDQATSHHYTNGNLLDAIEAALTSCGKSPAKVSIDDLAPVDEFHIGGRGATEHFMEKLGLQKDQLVLDVGCGLGGAARYVAATFNTGVRGIDLTQEYIDTGNVLCGWVKLDNQVNLTQGTVLSMPCEDCLFDAAYMMHVGMNIADKQALFEEVYRVLSPGASFGIYDIMELSSSDIGYPVPWANTPATSFLATPATYQSSLEQAGFEVQEVAIRDEFAKTFFTEQRKKVEAAGGPPPLGLHTLIGTDTAAQFANLVEAIFADKISPAIIIAKKKS